MGPMAFGIDAHADVRPERELTPASSLFKACSPDNSNTWNDSAGNVRNRKVLVLERVAEGDAVFHGSGAALFTRDR